MTPSTYYAVLLALVLGVGCGEGAGEQVVGMYELTGRPDMKLFLREGGTVEFWRDGDKKGEDGAWVMRSDEVFILGGDLVAAFFRISNNGDLELVALEDNGIRSAASKSDNMIFKRLK